MNRRLTIARERFPLVPDFSTEHRAVAELIGSALHHPETPAYFTDDYSTLHETHSTLVARVAGTVAGVALYDEHLHTSRECQEGWLEILATLPALQGSGIGSALIEKTAGYARSRHMSGLNLAALRHDTKLADFYMQRGFTPCMPPSGFDDDFNFYRRDLFIMSSK